MHLDIQRLKLYDMENPDSYFWMLIEQSSFLREYLTEIERRIDPEDVVRELVGFYREVDELIWEIREEFSGVLVYSL